MQQSANRSPVVTFDLGGVVVRICPTLQDAAHLAGVAWRDLHHPERPEQVGGLLSSWQVGGITDEAFFEAWADAVGGRFDREEARRILEAWLLGEYDGMAALAERLHASDLRLGCLSNTCHHHWEMMLAHPDRFPTLARLDMPHASHLFGHMKPDARIFELYEEAVGARGPQIVYFDDAAENVAAALSRDWRAYRIGPSRPPAEQVEEALHDLGLLHPQPLSPRF